MSLALSSQIQTGHFPEVTSILHPSNTQGILQLELFVGLKIGHEVLYSKCKIQILSPQSYSMSPIGFEFFVVKLLSFFWFSKQMLMVEVAVFSTKRVDVDVTVVGS